MLLNCGVGENSESPLDCKEIQGVHPKGNQSWIFIGRSDVEAEAPILWPPDAKNWLIRKDPDAGKDWRREEKGTKEDAMVGWHHQLSEHEFASTPGVGDGQGGLACCSPWGCKELDTTEQLNWTEHIRSSCEGAWHCVSPQLLPFSSSLILLCTALALDHHLARVSSVLLRGSQREREASVAVH